LENQGLTKTGEKGPAEGGQNLVFHSRSGGEIDPGWAEIMQAWPQLPGPVKAAIKALVGRMVRRRQKEGQGVAEQESRRALSPHQVHTTQRGCLHRGDIEAIRIGDIHFDRNTIATRNRKAGKAMAERPIPEGIMTELSNYVATLPEGREKLFTDRFSPKKWERIRKVVKLPNLKFPDLRRTFASLLAQRGVSTAVTQRLLEHSSPQLMNDVYTNVDPVLRQAVNQLPVADWI
jgi:integrase